VSRLEQTLNKPKVVLVVGVLAVALNVLLYFGLFLPRMTPLIAHINPIGTSLPEAIGEAPEAGSKPDPKTSGKSDSGISSKSDSGTNGKSDPEASGKSGPQANGNSGPEESLESLSVSPPDPPSGSPPEPPPPSQQQYQ